MKKNNKIKDMNEYKKENKNNYKKGRSKKIKNKMKLFLFVMGVMGILIGNLFGYATISKLKYEIHYLKKELKQEEIALDEVRSKVDTKTSIQEIEKKAKEELNMDYPRKNQIEYIEVEN